MAGPCPPLGRAPELCQLCGWAPWLGLVLLLSSSWLQKGALRARSTERKTEKDKLEEKEKEKKREKALTVEVIELRLKEDCELLVHEAPASDLPEQRAIGKKPTRASIIAQLLTIQQQHPQAAHEHMFQETTGYFKCRKKERKSPPLGRAPEPCQLCGWALSSSCRPLGRAPELCQLCGWAPWLGLVLLLASSWPHSVNSVAGLRGWALSSSCPPLGRAPELCQLCGWALWLGLVLLLAAPLNSVSSSCLPLGRTLELCQLVAHALTYAPERRAQSALYREKDRER